MENQPKLITSPYDVCPRFCGYCASKLMLNEKDFLIHVNACELKRCQKIWGPNENRK